MGKQLLLLILLLITVFFGISTQVKKNESRDAKQFVGHKNATKIKEDKLLEWMTYMKNESQRYRDLDEVSKAVEVLTRCIDGRWREPRSEEEREKLAWIYTNRAYFYNNKLGDYLAAKEDYLSALNQFESCKPSEYLVARYVYQPLGNIYTRLGENEIAISMIEKFKRACEKSGETAALMSAYNDIGRVFLNMDEFEQAVSWVSSGIALDNSDNFSLSLLYASKAEAEEKSGRYDESLLSAQKCIQSVDKFHRSTDRSDFRYEMSEQYKITAVVVKAKIAEHRNVLELAQQLYREALELSKNVYPKTHRSVARIHAGLGNSYELMGQNIKALECYQLSLQSMVSTISANDFSVNPSKSEIYADVVFGEAFIRKGIIAHNLFKEKGGGLWLKMSVESYLKYFEWVEIHRSEQFEFNTKLKTASEIHRNGEMALSALFDLAGVDKNRDWIDTAFVIMDQTKAIVLAEERGFKDLARRNPEMRSLLKEQNALKFQRSIFKSGIEKAEIDGDSKEVQRLKTRLTQLDQRSQLLDREIRALFPSYRTQGSAKLEAEVMARLKNKVKSANTSLLSYFIGDDRVYIISGSLGDLSFSTFERERLTDGVTSFLSELKSPSVSNAASYSRAAKNLFDLIIGKRSVKLGSDWLIFPDGVLNELPFEALVSDTSKGSNSFKQMNYVLRDHVIHYAPSAFFYAHEDFQIKPRKSFLGVAPVFKDSKAFNYLPKSVQEFEQGTTLYSGDVLVEAKATKKRFFCAAANYDILHISTHAGRNSGDNNDAWMVFSDVNSKDHLMVAPELLKLELSARLVVLNACETGSGTVFKGEGPLSLARGFLDAGAQSTVTNLWSVNHESNAEIMKSFYEYLSETQSPSLSLSSAKLNYLSNGEIDEASAHPYYWSAAVLIGTDVSVNEPSASIAHWILISLGVVLALVLGVVWYRKKRIA